MEKLESDSRSWIVDAGEVIYKFFARRNFGKNLS